MILLPGTDLPADRASFERALKEGVDRLLSGPAGRPEVIIRGEAWPALEGLEIDLGGMAVRPEALGRRPQQPERFDAELRAGFLDVRAEPVLHEEARLNFRLSAQDVNLGIGPCVGDSRVLALKGASRGELTVHAAAEALEALLLAVARKQARGMGAAVDGVSVVLESVGERSLHIRAKVEVRKMVTAAIDVSARIDIDDRLDAVLSGVSIRAGGFLGRVLGGMLDGYAEQMEGKRISLAAFNAGNVRLHELQVDASDGVKVTAQFGDG